MPRAKTARGSQREFLEKVKEKANLRWDALGQICGVCGRTIRDWKREKFNMNYEVLKKLHKIYNISLPESMDILPEYWSIPKAASAGGRATARLYGGPGTSEGRRKGGINSQRKFSLDPEYARKLGFKIRKKIKKPKRESLLAEFIGIMLGDGHIDKHQITVSMNNKVDQEYGRYVSQMIVRLFGIAAPMRVRKNTLIIVVSSRDLIDYLIDCGLKRGDKIGQQIDVPRWIFDDEEFVKRCLRGLIDTDGGIYFHNHVTKGIRYRHIGLCFTSRSLPLLRSVEKMFLILCLNVKRSKKDHLSLYGKEEIRKYLNSVGTSNPKHLKRFDSYKGSKSFLVSREFL